MRIMCCYYYYHGYSAKLYTNLPAILPSAKLDVSGIVSLMCAIPYPSNRLCKLHKKTSVYCQPIRFITVF